MKYDELRERCAETEALAVATETLFDGSCWDGQIDRQQIEHVAVLVGLVRRAAERALSAVDAANADAVQTAIPDPDVAAFDEPR